MVLDKTRTSKWDPIYEGPFTIVSQTNGGTYVLKDATDVNLDRRFTIDMLKIVSNDVFLKQ